MREVTSAAALGFPYHWSPLHPVTSGEPMSSINAGQGASKRASSLPGACRHAFQSWGPRITGARPWISARSGAASVIAPGDADRFSNPHRRDQAAVIRPLDPLPPERPKLVEPGIVDGLELQDLARFAVQPHRKIPGHHPGRHLAISGAHHPALLGRTNDLGPGVEPTQLAPAKLAPIARRNTTRLPISGPRSEPCQRNHQV